MRTILAAVLASTLAVSGCSREPDLRRDPHTRMVVRATSAATPETLDKAGTLIVQRIQAAGMGKAKFARDGDRNLVVELPGEPDQTGLRRLIGSGALTLRKVLDSTDGSAPADTSAKSETAPTLAEVTAKLGPAYEAARGLTQPADPADARLKPFAGLSPAEAAVLPAEIQFRVPAIGCPLLNDRPLGPAQDSTVRVVACDGGAKELLDVAKVTGSDVKSAAPKIEQSGMRVVEITFTAPGQAKWTGLTKEAFTNTGAACAPAAVGDAGRCRVAFVLDNVVISAPQVLGVITGNAILFGDFNSRQADIIAAQLTYGALPVPFEVVSIDFVKP